MSEVSKIISDKIVKRKIEERGEFDISIGSVVTTDPTRNTCEVIYENKMTGGVIKESLPVKIHCPYGDQWFPEVDDIVTIESIRGIKKITGIPEEAYDMAIKSKSQLTLDIYPDDISEDEIVGTIF